MLAVAGVLHAGGGLVVQVIIAFLLAGIGALICGVITHFIYPAYERAVALLVFLVLLLLLLLG